MPYASAVSHVAVEKRMRNVVSLERDIVSLERDIVSLERDVVSIERDVVSLERDVVSLERDVVNNGILKQMACHKTFSTCAVKP